MSLSYQKILNICITSAPKEVILEEIKKYLFPSGGDRGKNTKKRIRPLVIFTPNPEQIVFSRSKPYFRDTLNWADVALPDGIGIVAASQILFQKTRIGEQQPIRSRIPGVEFVNSLAEMVSKRGIRVGLIGGSDGLAVRALECLQARYPGLEGWTDAGPELKLDTPEYIDGFGDAYWSSLAQKIREARVQMLFVGLGAPKQEYVIHRLVQEFEKAGFAAPVVMMAVGGTFNIIAGSLRRAPHAIRSIGLEWFWRLLQEPWRWKRQISLQQFVWLVIYERCVSSFRKRA